MKTIISYSVNELLEHQRCLISVLFHMLRGNADRAYINTVILVKLSRKLMATRREMPSGQDVIRRD